MFDVFLAAGSARVVLTFRQKQGRVIFYTMYCVPYTIYHVLYTPDHKIIFCFLRKILMNYWQVVLWIAFLLNWQKIIQKLICF
jgi:hypothetical protein